MAPLDKTWSIRFLLHHCMFVLFLLSAWHAARAADLGVHVTGLTSSLGKVAVAVYPGADGFPKEDAKAIQSAMLAIDEASKSAKTVFTGLPAGGYAVATFHDHNNSGKLETNFFGVPVKGYGFSNNVRPRMRAPTFDEARFTLPEAGARITIELAY